MADNFKLHIASGTDFIAEAFVKAIADVSKKDFSNVKIIFDISWVMISIIISLILFKGEIHGAREGTIISSLLVGVTIKFFRPLLHDIITKILKR